jgi:hypothetical protein
MNTLTKPSSQILQQGDELYTVLHVVNRGLFTNSENVINKTQLGYMVKWCGGGHVVQDNDKLIICSKIEDAQYETI